MRVLASYCAEGGCFVRVTVISISLKAQGVRSAEIAVACGPGNNDYYGLTVRKEVQHSGT